MTLAHLVDGGGWKSNIYLINGSSTAKASYTLAFRGDRGEPVLMSFADGRRDNQITGVVPPGGVIVLETPGIDKDPLAVASATLTTNGVLSGYGVLAEHQTGAPDREATVPLSPATSKGLAFPFDNTNGFVTSIALAVPCGPASGSTFTATAVDDKGIDLGHCELKLVSGGHLAFIANSLIPATADKRGVIRIVSSNALTYLSGIGLRLTPAGALTTMPPSPLPAVAAPVRPAVHARPKRR
jgi:hypothetical protein